VVHRFSANDEMAAWATFQNYEALQARYNVLNSRLALRLKGNRNA
jgi:hypothetical protein